MSDYYGDSTLEVWLAEEVYHVKEVPEEVVELFEEWRHIIENNIEGWMLSHDGEGNQLSWRGWGRGFAVLSDDDYERFKKVVNEGKEYIERGSEP